MTTLREAAQMALMKMEYMMNNGEWYKPEEAVEALRAALAQPETPYLTGARLFREGKGISFIQTAVRTDADIGEALQGWEDAKERKEIIRQQKDFWGPVGWELECAKAIEAKLKEKTNKAQPPCKTGSQCVGNKCEQCAVQPEREWVGLTDEEIEQGMKQAYSTVQGRNLEVAFARVIEAKLREKNA